MDDDFETSSPDKPSKDMMRDTLAKLKKDHRQIDAEINALYDIGTVDMLKIRRMKKLKLTLKDKITFIENQITPDIIA